MVRIARFLLCLLFICPAAQGQPLLFDEAIERALNLSPTLQIASSEAYSTKGQKEQAGLYPNPQVSYEIESFAGNKDWRGWGHREERYFYTQMFETANKRQLRYQTFSYQYYASLVGYEAAKLILLNRLSRAFSAVSAAQELVVVAQEQEAIAQEMYTVAKKKVDYGKDTLIQQKKAEVAYFEAVQDHQNAITFLSIAKRKLALMWGSTNPDFAEVFFPFYELQTPAVFEECLLHLCNQPEIIQNAYQHLSAQENWRFEKANRIPNVTLQAGYKADYGSRDQGLLAGISIPIPLFDQNQGNIKRAYFDMLKTGHQGQQLWLLLENKLAVAYEELQRAYGEAKRIKEQTLRSAISAFELAEKGYNEGKFEYLDVLDAQRTLFDVKKKYIEALNLYHSKRADIDYLNSQTD
ncbi:MAG: TolC family protein [Parachlamydiaceae bacterium]